MIDISEIFKSQELRNAVTAIEALIAKNQTPQAHAGQKTFAQLALGRTLNAREVIAIVYGNQPSNPGMKEVLSSGLVGWTLLPDNKETQLALMTQAMVTYMDESDRAAGLVDQPFKLAGDIVSRYVLTGMPFLTGIVSHDVV